MSLTSLFTDIANAIRNKKGTTDPIPAQNFASEIESISAGGDTPAGGETTTYNVKVIDYDGTILKEEKVVGNSNYTLPNPPTHDRITFHTWVSQSPINNNQVLVEDHDVLVGATYNVNSGKNEFDIEVNDVVGMTINLTLDGEKDWGDGIVDTESTHTYSVAGKYTILCNGTTMGNNGIFNQGSTANCQVINARLFNNITLVAGALVYCSKLETVVLPTNHVGVLPSLFNYCYSLKAVVLPPNTTNINGGFSTCYSLSLIAIPSTVTEIYNSTFANSGLSGHLDLSSVINIGQSAFSKCYALERVTLSKGVKTLGNQCFYYCRSLKSINLEDSLTSLGASCFGYCDSLQEIKKLPGSIGYIPTRLFDQCSALNDFEIGEGITTIMDYCFNGCYSLKNITFPSTVKSTNPYAFSTCYALEKVNFLGDAITYGLGNYFFKECYNLEEFIYPNSITSSGQSVFSVCYKLKRIKMPANLTTMGSGFTTNCYSLIEIDFSESSVVPTLSGANLLGGSFNKGIKIYVPDSLYDEWITATNWSTYAMYIHKASEKGV